MKSPTGSLAAVLCAGLIPLAAFAQNIARPYSEGIKVTPLLKTSTTVAGQPIVYTASENPEFTAVIVEIPPGKQTGWHKHPVSCYAYVAQGVITVEFEDGSSHEYKAGEAVAEAVNLLHNGTNKGAESVKIIMFALGSKGVPFSVITPPPANRQ